MPSSTYTVTTLDDEELTKTAPPDYAAALRSVANQANGGKVPTRANISGKFVFEPSHIPDTTQVTLTLTASFENTDKVPRSKKFADFKQGGFQKTFGSGAAQAEVGATSIINHILAAIPSLHTRFARYDEVDEATLQHFETEIVTNAPALTKNESSFVTRSLTFESPNQRRQWKRMARTILEPVSYFQKVEEGDDSKWGKAFGKIDVSASRVFSWLWNAESNERVLAHVNSLGSAVLRKFIPVPNSHSMFCVFLIPLTGGIDDRLFAIWLTWHIADNGDIIIAFTEAAENKDHQDQHDLLNKIIASDARASKAVRGSTTGLWRIESLAPNVCRVTYIVRAKMNGFIPRVLVNASLKSQLMILNELQDKYLRNGKMVDAEMRAAFSTPPSFNSLSAEQHDVVAHCRSDLEAGVRTAWENLHSPFPFVKMWIKHTPTRRGEKSIALGMAEGIVDCPVKEAAAWCFDACSRDRLRISLHEGNPARLIAKETTSHDNVCATIKKMPALLHNREFISRQICYSDNETGDIIIVGLPLDESIDYGANTNTVRGTSKVFFRFIALNENQCKVIYISYLDAGGHVPAVVTNSKISLTLSVVEELRAEFARDDEIDEFERNKVALIIRDEPQVYDSEETDLIERSRHKLAACKEEDFESLESPDHLVEMKLDHKEEEGALGRAITVVDASVEDCAAWELNSMCREFTKSHHERGGLDRNFMVTNQHCGKYHLVIDLQIPGLQPREWVSHRIWKWNGDSKDQLEVFAEDFEDSESYPINPKFVRAKSFAYYSYEKLEPLGGFPRTRVTYAQAIDLGGIIPKWIASSGMVDQLMYTSVMRTLFDKSLAIDVAIRNENVDMIKNHTAAYTKDEDDIIENGMSSFVIFHGKSAKNVAMESPTTAAKVAFKTGDIHAWGWSKAVVRGAPEEIVAWMWDIFSRCTQRSDDLERSIDETPNDHNKLVYMKKKTPAVVHDRDFLGSVMWKRAAVGDEGFVFVTCPKESNDRPHLSGVVRGKYPSAMKITRLNDTASTIEYVVNPDVGGRLPVWLSNSWLAANLAYVTEIQQYFLALRRWKQWDASDGKEVGEVLVIKTKEDKRREKGETKVEARMRKLFVKYKGLKEVGKKYEFLQCMMVRVVQNKLRPARDMRTKLCDVSKKEGRTIGAGLAMSLASSLTAEAAVDEWIGKYPALKELDREEVWFRPMMNTVAIRLLGEVSWGLKMRVSMGAGLSVLDMASDINVILLYMGDPDTEEYAKILMAMIVLCLVLQLCSTCILYQKTPLVRLLRELLIVLTGLKPGCVLS